MGTAPGPAARTLNASGSQVPPGPCAPIHRNPFLDLFQGFYDPSGCTRRPSTLASCPLSRRRDHQCNYHHHHLSALCFLLSAFCLCLLYATFCYPDLCSLLSAFCSILSTFFFSFCSRQSVGVSTAPGLLRAFTPFFSSYHTHSPAPFGPRPHWAVVL